MRVQATNFQCFQNLDIELDGFTVIVGPTNNGKSALTRVLRAGLYNNWHPSFIREGAKETSISISDFVPNASTLSRISITKSSSKNLFEIETGTSGATSYPKVGTSTPEEVKDAGFSFFETDKESFNLNFQTQFESLFLLTEGYSTFTQFFNALFKVDSYEWANQKAMSDLISLNREANTLNEAIPSYEEDLKQKGDEYTRRNNLSEFFEQALFKSEALSLKLANLDLLINLVREHQGALDIASKKAEEAKRFSDLLTPVLAGLSSRISLLSKQTETIARVKELTEQRKKATTYEALCQQVHGIISSFDLVHKYAGIRTLTDPSYPTSITSLSLNLDNANFKSSTLNQISVFWAQTVNLSNSIRDKSKLANAIKTLITDVPILELKLSQAKATLLEKEQALLSLKAVAEPAAALNEELKLRERLQREKEKELQGSFVICSVCSNKIDLSQAHQHKGM